jgi:hypothetical protein
MTDKTSKIRDYDSFKWLPRGRFSPALGFGWSANWLDRHPWSYEGNDLPYIGVTLIKDTDTFKYHIITIGPVVIHHGKYFKPKV